MQLFDERLALVGLKAELSRSRVAGVGSAEGDRVVPPIVAQPLPGARVDAAVFRLVELENRQKLHAIDAQLFQIRNLFPQAGKSAGMLDARRGTLREAADVHLVNY